MEKWPLKVLKVTNVLREKEIDIESVDLISLILLSINMITD